MADLSLADFFATYHGCNNWTLQKAVMRCTYGRERNILRKAAYAWQPEIYFHNTLKRLITADEPQRLPHGYITPDVTRVRNKLETWLRHYWLPRQNPEQAPEALEASPPDSPTTIRQTFNSATYSHADIETAVWFVLQSPFAMQLMNRAQHWSPTNAWEQKLRAFMMDGGGDTRPKLSTRPDPYVYRPLIGKIKSMLRKNLW